MYTSVLRKSFHGCQPTLLLYLARAYYDAGDLKEARSVLLKAVHLAPSDHRLHFNIALTMQACFSCSAGFCSGRHLNFNHTSVPVHVHEHATHMCGTEQNNA